LHYSYNECIPELSIHQDAFKIMKLSSLRNSPCPIHSTQNFHFEKDPKDDRTSGFHSELLYQISAPPIKDHPVKQAFSPLRETSARTLNHVYEKRIDQLCTLTLFIWRAKSKKNPPSLQAPTFTSSSFLLIVSQKFAGAVQQRKDFKAALPPPLLPKGRFPIHLESEVSPRSFQDRPNRDHSHSPTRREASGISSLMKAITSILLTDIVRLSLSVILIIIIESFIW